MLPRTQKDIHALELGFLADNVLQTLSCGLSASQDLGSLRKALLLLRGISAGVGTWSPEFGNDLPLNALGSFAYAAEALKLSHTPRVADSLRTHFGSLADTLDQIINGQAVDEAAREAVVKFFEGLSDATLESWNANQSPTLLGA